MKIVVETLESGQRAIHLSGRLDLKGSQAVETEFMEGATAQQIPLLLDLSEVSYVASVGLQLIIRAVKELAPHQLKMVLFRPQKLVEQMLRLAGIDIIIPIEHDLPEALRILSESSEELQDSGQPARQEES